MKRMTAVLALLLSLQLCGCDGGGQNTALPASNLTRAPAGETIPEQSGRGDALTVAQSQSGFTLFADFSAGAPEMEPRRHDIPLPPKEEMPPSNTLTAFFLADSLSEWTGLDFSLNAVTFNENSVTVDWSAESTLVAGLDERKQKADFHFHDAVSLNWFMMDSLALTLKHNLAVTTVYYCSDGGPVAFTNPEDMTAQGLPALLANRSYEGSAFYVSHADA